jgi:molybdopterin synthase sulfur carrier subunit
MGMPTREAPLYAGMPPQSTEVAVSVEVHIPTVMRAATDGVAQVPSDGSTVGEVLTDLVSRFPGLDGQLLGADGALHKFVNVYVNDDDVRYLDKLDTKVGPGDTLSILPAVAGG